MKTLYNLLGTLLLAIPLLLVSCKEDHMETNLGDAPFVLATSEQEVALDVTSPQSTALEFEWTTGSNYNTNAAITYTFELGVVGTNFENAVQTVQGEGKTSLTYTHQALNSLLIEHFGSTPNSKVELEGRVVLKVHNETIQPQTSNAVQIAVTSYKPISSTLYLIGSAAPNGWDADNATRMNSVSGAAGGFVWQGKLNAGELKFITTLGNFLPSYNRGDDDTKLYFRESDDDSDDKFVIATTGIYQISLNILNLVITIDALDAPEFSDLWFVGNPTGWSFQPMKVDGSDPFIFHYNADLSAGGEFKIATAENWDAVFFRPVADQTSEGTDQEVVKWAGDPDYKWNITGGVYKIKLDTRDMKIDIVPFTPYAMIYLVGDATPNGWDIGGATPMSATDSPYLFRWTGTLNGGEMKFTCDKQSDWNGDWFLASANGIAPSGVEESMLFSTNGANPDNKWVITEPGTYSIELNQLQQTVVIAKQ